MSSIFHFTIKHYTLQYNKLRWLLKHVGVEDFRIHDLRHTCASWLMGAGQQLTAVRDLLGHSSVQMTERYAHTPPENVRTAVSALDGVAQNWHTNFNVTELDSVVTR